jgi:phosphomannomutase / phosphoglucomutase
MTMSPHIFRKYDIRGVVDDDLTVSVVRDVGRALGTRCARGGGKTFGIGRDCRTHSPKLRDALAEGLSEAGLQVVDFGMVPTPLLYFAVFFRDLDGGVQITGSHNPPEFNGLKMMMGKDTLHGDEIQDLKTAILSGDLDKNPGGGVREEDILTPYLDYVVDNVNLGDRKLTVVADAGNGVGGIVAAPLLERLGMTTHTLFIEPDGTFPNHHPDPADEHNLEDLIAKVAETGADIGVAYDGDGDRIGVVDDKGNIIAGDRLMIILSRALLAEEPGATIVGEVKCSQTLYDDIAARGGNGIMWKVGHSLIKSKMKESGALLAGEMSGHIFFKHRWFGFDDALYTTARVIELLTQTQTPLSDMLADVPVTYATPEVRIDVPDAIKFDIANWIATELAKDNDVVAIDGVRVIFPDGWGLVRASNTQPALVLRTEAQSPERRDEIAAMLRSRIEQAQRELRG